MVVDRWDSQIEKKVVKAPVKATPKPEFKSAPLVQSSASSVSSDESSEDDDDDDNDDEEVEEEEEEKPALKKKKATPLVATPALKEKKQRKHWELPFIDCYFFFGSFGVVQPPRLRLSRSGTAVGCVCHSFILASLGCDKAQYLNN